MIEKQRITNYARALCRYALKRNLLDKIKKDLTSIKEVIWNDLSVRSYFIYPAIEQKEKENFLTEICRGLEVDYAVKKSIFLLIEKGLFSLVPALVDKYNSLSQEEKEQGHVIAKTPYPLTSEEKDAFCDLAKSLLNKEIILEEKRDPQLLAGFQMLCVNQGIKIECSLKAKLDKLREELAR